MPRNYFCACDFWKFQKLDANFHLRVCVQELTQTDKNTLKDNKIQLRLLSIIQELLEQANSCQFVSNSWSCKCSLSEGFIKGGGKFVANRVRKKFIIKEVFNQIKQFKCNIIKYNGCSTFVASFYSKFKISIFCPPTEGFSPGLLSICGLRLYYYILAPP